MSRWRPSEDIRPVTEFRANASAMLDHLQTTQRPVVLTQHGRSAAVFARRDGATKRSMDELTLLRDIKTAEAQVAKGRRSRTATVAKRLRAKLMK